MNTEIRFFKHPNTGEILLPVSDIVKMINNDKQVMQDHPPILEYIDDLTRRLHNIK